MHQILSRLDDGETTVFEVDWESAKWSPITRKLVNQSHSKLINSSTSHSRSSLSHSHSGRVLHEPAGGRLQGGGGRGGGGAGAVQPLLPLRSARVCHCSQEKSRR